MAHGVSAVRQAAGDEFPESAELQALAKKYRNDPVSFAWLDPTPQAAFAEAFGCAPAAVFEHAFSPSRFSGGRERPSPSSVFALPLHRRSVSVDSLPKAVVVKHGKRSRFALFDGALTAEAAIPFLDRVRPAPALALRCCWRQLYHTLHLHGRGREREGALVRAGSCFRRRADEEESLHPLTTSAPAARHRFSAPCSAPRRDGVVSLAGARGRCAVQGDCEAARAGARLPQGSGGGALNEKGGRRPPGG